MGSSSLTAVRSPTTCLAAALVAGEAEPTPSPTPAARSLAANRCQAVVIARLEARMARLRAELERLRDAPPTARSLAGEDRVREDLRRLDGELEAARDELARIVRAARREGAVPGWFRRQ